MGIPMAMIKIIKSFRLIINYKTFLITGLSVLSSYLCFKLGLTAKFPDMLVGVAIVFPVVFSIGSAYTRRETALQRFADFKGHAIAIYFATKDWGSNKENNLSITSKSLIHEMLVLMKDMFKTTHKETFIQNEKKIYTLFSKMSALT